MLKSQKRRVAYSSFPLGEAHCEHKYKGWRPGAAALCGMFTSTGGFPSGNIHKY